MKNSFNWNWFSMYYLQFTTDIESFNETFSSATYLRWKKTANFRIDNIKLSSWFCACKKYHRMNKFVNYFSYGTHIFAITSISRVFPIQHWEKKKQICCALSSLICAYSVQIMFHLAQLLRSIVKTPETETNSIHNSHNMMQTKIKMFM